ncbi:hypothetical protein Scep_024347 [Stephania cephalantha]|uniref:Uncharacterized protein n=1 Tax=Stephania cephalantha TaxID=152367 RepID=A0AAP0HX17_9MAGN
MAIEEEKQCKKETKSKESSWDELETKRYHWCLLCIDWRNSMAITGGVNLPFERLAVGIMISRLVFEEEDFVRPWEGYRENLEGGGFVNAYSTSDGLSELHSVPV